MPSRGRQCELHRDAPEPSSFEYPPARVISALFLVGFMLVAGYLARRFERLPSNASEVLNRFVIDICVPATILRLVPKMTLGAGLAALVITPWIMALLAYGFARIATRLLALDRATATALFLATALGNTSFLGFPLLGALLGERAIPLAAVYDQLGSFLLLSTVAPIALGRVTAGAPPRVRDLALRVLGFPPMIALLVALLVALVPLHFPLWLEPVLTAAAAPLVPLAMFAVGLKVRLVPPRPARVLALGLGLKLLVLPAVSWLLVTALRVPHFVVKVTVLETAMPTMITAGAMMMAYGVASDLAAAFVGWGLILALFTVPIWSLVLR
jgi:predicted permease